MLGAARMCWKEWCVNRLPCLSTAEAEKRKALDGSDEEEVLPVPDPAQAKKSACVPAPLQRKDYPPCGGGGSWGFFFLPPLILLLVGVGAPQRERLLRRPCG